MVRVNVDGDALRDTRVVKRLPRALGLDLYATLGRLVHVWILGYDQRSAIVTAIDIDDAANLDGFATAMIKAELAEDMGDGKVRIRGVADRIGYLLAAAENGRKGGRARAEGAPRKGGRFIRRAPSRHQAGPGRSPSDRLAATRPLPLPLPPAPVLPLPLAPDPTQPLPQEESPAGAVGLRRQEVIDCWAGLYRAQTGQPYHFTKVDTARIGRLTKTYTAVEVMSRIELLFSGEIGWLKPPFTIGSLEKNWNSLVRVQGKSAATGHINASRGEAADGEVPL